MKTKKIYRPEDPEFVMKPIIMACGATCMAASSLTGAGEWSAMLYWQCPYCGANLDPGERCDCKTEKPPRVLQHSQAAGGKTYCQVGFTASIIANMEVKHNAI